MPTPDRMHYTFNFRDLSRVIQGMLLLSADQYLNSQSFIHVWVHETFRVFHDRLIDEKDKEHFQQIIKDVANATLPVELLPNIASETLLFGDFMKAGNERREERQYKEISEPNAMSAVMCQFLEDYNSIYTKNPLDLVFFEDAVNHIARLARVLKIPGGHAMLVGVGGSGKMSTAKFATFVSGCHPFSIEVTRNYGTSEFGDDLRKLCRLTGIEKKPTAFILSDTQIVNESFLEDTSMLLATGEVSHFALGLVL